MLVHELIELLLTQPQNMPVVIGGGGDALRVEKLPAAKVLQYRDIVNGRKGPWRPHYAPGPSYETVSYGHPKGCVVIRHGGE